MCKEVYAKAIDWNHFFFAGALASAGMCVASITVSTEVDGQKWGMATFATPPTEKCLTALKTVANTAVLVTL